MQQTARSAVSATGRCGEGTEAGNGGRAVDGGGGGLIGDVRVQYNKNNNININFVYTYIRIRVYNMHYSVYYTVGLCVGEPRRGRSGKT